MNFTNTTKMFIENNGKSGFNGFIGGKLNYNKCEGEFKKTIKVIYRV